MEFFDWLSIPQAILWRIPWEMGTEEAYASSLRYYSLISILIAAGLYLIGLIFGGIGLYTIAKKTGIKHGWLGFVPFANTYLLGKIAGEANFFGQKMKRAGLYAMLMEIVYSALEIFLMIASFLLIRPEFFTYNTTYGGWQIDSTKIPASLQWAYSAVNYCEVITWLVWVSALVFMCVVFYAFFRKYYARSPFLLVFFSILPFRGFTVFAVRKNTPVDYNEYMRRRMEEYARHNSPYGYGGYGENRDGSPRGGQGGEDPFSDFGSSAGTDNTGGDHSGSNPPSNDDDPFSDF